MFLILYVTLNDYEILYCLLFYEHFMNLNVIKYCENCTFGMWLGVTMTFWNFSAWLGLIMVDLECSLAWVDNVRR